MSDQESKEIVQSSFILNEDPLEVDTSVAGKSRELLQIAEFRRQLESAIENTPGDIVITGHSGDILPDGDDVFSMVAMKRILEQKYPQKNIKIVMSDRAVHEWDKFFNNGEIIWANMSNITAEGTTRPGDVADFVHMGDMLLCLDQGSLSHFSRFPNKITGKSGIRPVIIDHHAVIADDRAGLRLRSRESVSTTEIIARMYAEENLSPDVCALLYMGMSSDTGKFSFRDYGDTKTFAVSILNRSGKSYQELETLLTPENLYKEYLSKFRPNHLKFEKGGKNISCEYISPVELEMVYTSDNPNYCLQAALRKAVGQMEQISDYDIRFTFSPANEANDGTMNPQDGAYKIEFRRKSGEPTNLSETAKKFGGGGHEGASGAVWVLPEENLKYITEHKGETDFNQMEYVANLIADKIVS